MKKVIKIGLLFLALIVIFNSQHCMAQNEEEEQYQASDAQVEEWASWLDDESLFAREESASALGRSNNPKAIPYLLKALKDESPSVRQEPARYLGDFGDKSIIPDLMGALINEEALNVQSALIKSMQKIGLSVEEEEMIKQYIKKLIGYGYATGVVINIQDKKIQKELLNELIYIAEKGANFEARIESAFTLVDDYNENPQKFEDLCINIIDSKGNPYEKELSIILLKRVETKRTISTIEKALNDENVWVRWRAEQVLEEIRNEQK